MKAIQLYQISPQELKTQISEDIKIQLEEFLRNFKPINPAAYLTKQEVAKMFKVNISTIHNWCKNGRLKPYGLGSRVYFLLSDIQDSLIFLNGKDYE